ncbi:HAD-IC family P-type ATPase [Benzoatithermus flavus]|uniref:HAD-IC family P-type ATPase n=1 Tax=Benzoatithermus flavus TaxID=3108223 RepID=A0ABU8XY62_9PROT
MEAVPGNETATPNWHALPAEAALAAVDGRAEGLSTAEALARRVRFGPNAVRPPAQRSALLRFLAQFHNVLIYVLLAAGLVTAALGDWIDATVIVAVVVINAAIGFIQEGRAEKALQAIRGLLSEQAVVLRDGRRQVVPAADLVPGDIVFLQSGDKVPADLRLLQVRSLQVQEAALTGESVPVQKTALPVPAEVPLGDRASLAFSGTLVTYGQGAGVVVATGDATEIGRIGRLLGETDDLTTPLLRQMADFSHKLAFLILAVAVLIFMVGHLGWKLPLQEMFSAAVALAVAAIPEGLPAVMTITLAIGVQRMARRNAIVRRLPAVETLGSVSVICSDKTGTLTRNEMMVESVATAMGLFEVSGEGYSPEGEIVPPAEAPPAAARRLLADVALGAVLCNESGLRRTRTGWQVDGDPMEGALLVLAHKAGIDADAAHRFHPRDDVIPFESEHRFMATLHHDHTGRRFLYVKGAPERIVAMCAREHGPEGDVPIDPARWQAELSAIARRGQRVLGLARKEMPPTTTMLAFADVEAGGCTLLCLFGIVDPPRREALAAVAACREAGIRVKMITGDHPDTALAIARQFRLENTDVALTGGDLDALDRAGFARAAAEVDVFARTTPEHKLRLVEALQAQGRIVAMTGDGVNDAPALKRADIGVAMGRRGTEAAKEAAQMVLVDDNFASIAHAVEEGRVVHDNLKKALLFFLGTNAAQALTITVAILFGWHLPITAAQILWVNLVTAITLGLALAFEVAEADVMRRPPRPAGEPLVGPLLAWRIALFGGLALLATLLVFELARRHGELTLARTMAVNTLVACEILFLFNVRRRSAAALSAEALKGLGPALASSGLIVLLQLVFTYWSPLGGLFGTVPLTARQWLPILLCALAMFVVIELEKLILRRWSGGVGRGHVTGRHGAPAGP